MTLRNPDNQSSIPAQQANDTPGTSDEPITPLEQKSGRRRWLRRGCAGIAAFVVVLAVWLAITAPLSKSLKPISPPQITLLAADGTPIARKGAIVEQPVAVQKLPKHVVQAFIAIEDRRFYDHWGIDPRGIARATWNNITTGRTEGGSTITQQLAKFTFLTSERSLTRKAREVLIAFWLEAWLTKDEILERYLSNAYFGDNTYGLRAASLHYFNRQPENLNLAQSAMLAGMMKAPSRLAPTQNYQLSADRMELVVRSMVDAGYLTAKDAKAIDPPRLDVRSHNELPTGTYFADWVLPQARKLSNGGYSRETYTTTLDARLQAAARRATEQSGLGAAQVALVAMRPNGEVVAMIGGKDYATSPFNRATQSRRQPGSTFKLFVYLAALRSGWQPQDEIDNRKITVGGYSPRNSGDIYSDSITMEDAFAQSSNVATVRLFNDIGDDAVIGMARDLGVESALPRGDPSLALGTSSMTLLELTAAYAGVAGNSFPVVPTAFKAEKSGWFDWLFDGRDSLRRQNHEDMEQLLRSAVSRGTGRAATLGKRAYGKTGTSQDNRDALFIGYAGELVVGVWVGNDDNSSLKGVSGGGLPARIWRNFMRQALRMGAPPRARPDPQAPVQPLDVPDASDIPTTPDTSIRVENGQATISSDIGGVPVDVRIDQSGIRLGSDAINDEIGRVEAGVRSEAEKLDIWRPDPAVREMAP